jgi:hypothetical protein
MKDAVKTFIMNSDPSVKKLPSLNGGLQSPEQEHVSMTSKKLSEKKPLLFYSDSKYGLSQKSSMLTI